MIGIIEQLNTFGWMTVISVIFLIIAFIPKAVESWRDLLDSLGLISKRQIKEQNQKDEIAQIRENLRCYQDSIFKKQNEYHDQSIQIRNKLRQDQEKLSLSVDTILESMSKVNHCLDDLKEELVNEKIERMRCRVIDFATELRNGQDAGVEQYNNVLDTYTEYERLIAESGKTNGLVNASIAFIQDKYQELLQKECK